MLDHLIFYKRISFSYTTAYFVETQVQAMWRALMAPVIIEQNDTDNELLMTQLQGYHILYHHNQGVIERKTYRSLAKIFSVNK